MNSSWVKATVGLAMLIATLIGYAGPEMEPWAGRVSARGAPEPTPDNHLFLPALKGAGKSLSTSHVQSSSSTPIAVSPLDGTIWVANPDSGSVSVVHGQDLKKIAEIPVGAEPWSLAITPDGGRVFVVDRAAGTLVAVDAGRHQVVATIPVGAEPGTVALSPITGATAYVTLMAEDAIIALDTDNHQVLGRVDVAPKPYALAVTTAADGVRTDERLYVTHLLALPRAGGAEAHDDGREGLVTVIDLAVGTNVDTATVNVIRLAPDDNGFPNLLAGIAVHGRRAWIPHVRAAPALPNGLTTTVFAAVSALDLQTTTEDLSGFLPLNDQTIFGSPVNNPVAAVPGPGGERLYVLLAGSDLVEVIDVGDPQQPRLVKFLPTGRNPRGIALSADGSRAYVMNYLSRSVTVLDLDQFATVSEVDVTGETLAPDVLHGKILFNNAANPKLSHGSWISCASCHFDGLPDGVTWFFPDGPRQTPMLWNAGQTLPWHWSAALDEPHDVEETVHLIQHGLGLAPGPDPPLLGPPNAGRAQELDALSAFLTHGIRPLAVPTPSSGDTSRGRQLFVARGCVECHGGPDWTSSTLPGIPGTLDPDGNGVIDEVLHDVGTHTSLDVRPERGFDSPSLLSVALTAPYLHNGSQPTLESLLRTSHPLPAGKGSRLTEPDIADLAAFLYSIGPATLLE